MESPIQKGYADNVIITSFDIFNKLEWKKWPEIIWFKLGR